MLDLLTFFVTPKWSALLITAAGLAVMFRQMRIAATLGALAIGAILLPVLLEPAFAALPSWLLYLIGFWMLIALLRAVMQVFIGRRATDHAMGELAAAFILALIFTPLRLIRGAVRLIALTNI